MLNAEKFKDKILSIADDGYLFAIKKNDKGNVIRCCSDMNCQDCIFDDEESEYCGYNIPRLKWLFAEYKEPVKLTRFEHDVLKHLIEKTQYRFIVREKSDNIYIYKRKPKKGTGAWDISSGMQSLNIFANLFPFIKWEDSEPTSIEYVLKNCEVVNDAEE